MAHPQLLQDYLDENYHLPEDAIYGIITFNRNGKGYAIVPYYTDSLYGDLRTDRDLLSKVIGEIKS